MRRMVVIDKSTLVFSSKDLDWELKNRQLKEIERLWKNRMGVRYISMSVKINPHVVFLALYEMWMDGKINDIGKALPIGPSDGPLLVSGREQLKRFGNKGGFRMSDNDRMKKAEQLIKSYVFSDGQLPTKIKLS